MSLITRYSHLNDGELLEEWRRCYQDMLAALMWKSGKSDQKVADVAEVEDEISMRMHNFGSRPVDPEVVRAHYAHITEMERELESIRQRKRQYAYRKLKTLIRRLQARVSPALDYGLMRHCKNARLEERRKVIVEKIAKHLMEIANEMSGMSNEIQEIKPESISRREAATVIAGLQKIQAAAQEIEDFFAEFAEVDEESMEQGD